MLDVNALKAEIMRNGYTQSKLAEALGMSSRTFSNRLKDGDFGVCEIESMTQILNLKRPFDIFFAK